jgi:hypothetical protein
MKRPAQHGPTVTRAESEEALVELLVGYVDRAYVTAGQPGALLAVRELFRRMSHVQLAALTYELGLMTEPPREDGGEERR